MRDRRGGHGQDAAGGALRRRGARARRGGAARAHRRGDRRAVPAVRRSAAPLRRPRGRRTAGDRRRGARAARARARRCARLRLRRAREPPLPAVRGGRRAARPRRRRAAAAARRRGPPVGGAADAAAAPPRRAPPARPRRCSCSSRCATRRPTSSPIPRGCSPTSAASTSSSASRSRGSRRRRPPSWSATPSSRAASTAARPATRSSSRRCCAASRRRPTSRRACPRASRTSSRAGCRGWTPGTVETLTAAAVLGRDFRLATLEAMVARPGEDLLGPLEEALRASVVREDAEHVDRFAFAHALVRETLYDAPAHARRARLHLRAGQALESAGAPPGELAHHFFEAREVGGAEAAVTHSAAAARHAVAAHAYEEAAWHLEQALAALPAQAGDPRGRPPGAGARSFCSRSATSAGRPARPARATPSTRPRRSPGARTPPTCSRARCSAPAVASTCRSPPTPPTSRSSRRRSTRSPEEGALRARLLARLAEHLALADAGDRPAELGAEAVKMARGTGDEGALAAALMGRHAALLGIEHVEERLTTIDEAIALAERLERRGARSRSRCTGASTTSSSSATSPGRRSSHARLEALARELHQPLYTHAALAWRGEWAHMPRPPRGGRAHPPRVAADRRGGRRLRGARLLPHAAVRRPPRPGAPGRDARADRAARAAAGLDRRHLARAAPARAAAGGGDRARPYGLRDRAGGRQHTACPAASSASAASSAWPRRARSSATRRAPTS